MDKNRSGFVDKEELMEWIRHSTKKGIYEDTQKRWDYYDRDKSGDVHFDEWVKSSYSYMAGACADHTKGTVAVCCSRSTRCLMWGYRHTYVCIHKLHICSYSLRTEDNFDFCVDCAVKI